MVFRRFKSYRGSQVKTAISTLTDKLRELFVMSLSPNFGGRRHRHRIPARYVAVQVLEPRMLLAGTAVVVDDNILGGGINNGTFGSDPSGAVDVGGIIYFTAGNGIDGGVHRINSSGIAEMVTDAVPVGGVIPNPGSSYAHSLSLTNVNGALYFLSQQGQSDAQLWRVNSAGFAERVTFSYEINTTPTIQPNSIPVVVNSTMYFTVRSNSPSDIRDVFRANSAGIAERIFSNDSIFKPANFTNVNGTFFFSAKRSGVGEELWRVNGAGSVELVEDSILGGGIGVGLNGAYAKYFTNHNGTLYFTANDGTNGTELWRVGSTGLAQMVDDAVPGGGIRPGSGDGVAGQITGQQFVNAAGTLYFQANDGTNGTELWRINAAGSAEMVEDHVPGGGINLGAASSAPREQTNVNGQLYFRANNSVSGSELWRVNSSGIAELVEDSIPGGGINPGSGTSYPQVLTNVSGTLYFRANDGTNGIELWKVNDAGVAVLIEDAVPGGGIAPGAASSIPDRVLNVNGTLYFSANDGSNGNEFWRVNSEGVAEMVEDSVPGGGIRAGVASPIENGTTLWNLNGAFYFAANDGSSGLELWRINSSGIAETVEDSIPGGGINAKSLPSSPSSLTPVNDVVYFTADDGTNGVELWRADSSGVATLVEDAIPGGGINPGNAASTPRYLTNVNGTVYFQANDGTSGVELWRINSAGTAVLVEDAIPGGGINPTGSSTPAALVNVSGVLYFRANDGTNGIELWKINSSGQAVMVEDAVPGGGISPFSDSFPSNMTNVNGTLYFTANDAGPSSRGVELWRLNASGTAEMVEDSVPGGGIRPGSNSSYPALLTNVGGLLYFQANDGTNGLELWRINNSGRAEMVEDAVPGGGIGPSTVGSNPRQFIDVSGTLYFLATDGTNGNELWTVNSSGTAVMVEDSVPGSGINPFNGSLEAAPKYLTNANGTLYFQDIDGINGWELWRIDSTGTAEMVEDAIPGHGINPISGSYPRYMIVANNTLYFQADDGTNGLELWRINSTGTALMVEDTIPGGGINPGSAGSSAGFNGGIVNVNGILLFTAFNSLSGAELWRINAFGLAVMVEDNIPAGGINPGSGSSTPSYLTNVNGTLFFSADDGYTNGLELWMLQSSELIPSLPDPNTPVSTSLAPELDAGGNERIFTGDTFSRSINFRDEDSSNLTLTVNYGDGSGLQSLDYRRADRSALLHHVYDKSAVYTVTVSVQDDSTPAANVAVGTFQITVLNTPPEIAFNDVLLTKRINEGETVSLSGSFQDLGVNDAHTIEVDWGDGTPIVIQNVAVGARTYSLNHRYDDDGASRADSHVYRVVVTVRDQSGASSATPVFLVEVDNVNPSNLVTTLNQATINEGGSVQVDGSFVDPGLLDTHLVYVNWGDGSPRQRINASSIQQTGTLRQFSATHTYRDNPTEGNSFAITVNVSDDDNPLTPVSTVLNVTVNNVNPSFVGIGGGRPALEISSDEIFEGSEISLVVRFTDPGHEIHTLTVNWGDGSPVTLISLLPGTVNSQILRHTYANASSFVSRYTLTATVTDRDLPPLASTVSKPIAVYNVAPVITDLVVSTTAPIFEGDEVSLSGSFSDPGLGETYSADVDWGDGSVTSAEIDPVTRTYSARHRYLDDSPYFDNLYSIFVAIQDGVHNGFQQTFAEVINVAPALSILPVIDPFSNPNLVLRAIATDVSPIDQDEIYGTSFSPGEPGYTWSLSKDGEPVPFDDRWWTNEIELDPTQIPDGDAPLILTVTADDGDGGITTVQTILILGTESDDVLTVTDSSIPDGFRSALILGFDGYDILDASGVTRSDVRLTMFGGFGDDMLFDGTGNDIIILGAGNDSLNLPQFDFWNTLQILPNMGGDDEVFLIPNSTLTAYDSVGNNTLNFSLADSSITQDNGITFDLDQTIDRGFGIEYQDVAPDSFQPNEHFVAALGTFGKLIGSNYADKLTGASNASVFGGMGEDQFFTKSDITDATFNGGADADVLTARGRRVARIRFNGDDGADELHVDDFAEILDDLDFDGGNDADIFINRGRVARVIFKGGADADVLQNQKGRISRIRFQGDDGIDTFINEEFASIEWQDGDDPALQAEQGIDFDGGSDADVLINRGRVSRVVFKGGADADILRNQKGRISRIRFQGDDGIDTFTNYEGASIEWLPGDDPDLRVDQGIDFDGGRDADILINRGRVSRVVFKGGADADVLRNQKGRISRIRFQGDDGEDQLINDENDEGASIEWLPGDDPDLQSEQGIDFDGGNDADILINRGRVSRVVFRGGADADVLQNQRGRISRVQFQGDDGADTFINEELAQIEWQDGDDLTLQAEQGIDFDGGDDADILINRGRVSRVVFKGGADADVLQNQRGRVSRVRFQGDDGEDVLFNDEFATIEWQTGDDPGLQLEQGIDFDGGNDADILINRGRVSRVVFKGGADADVLQNRKGRITRIVFTGDDGADRLINEEFATIEWQVGDDPELLLEQGIDFEGGNDADVLINRGRVSRVVFRGGADSDLLDLQSGEVTDDVLFEGGDDADVLIARSRARRIRFNGDAGADEFLITGEVNGDGPDDGLIEFNGGDDADVLVSRGTLRKLVFRGGADDDVLQTSGGSIQELEFYSDAGLGILVNRTDNIGSLTYFGGDEADMFINRGQNIGDLTFRGGLGDDVFVNSGSTNPASPGILTFDAGDGSNAMRNEGNGWAELIYTGGLGENFLQNNAGGISLLNYNGGTGSNALENNASGISNIVVQGSNDDDIFANDGDNVSGIQFFGLNGTNTLINTGANVSGIQFFGGAEVDRFVNSGFALKNSTFRGEAGDDRFFNYGANTENVTMFGDVGADWWINHAAAGSGHDLRFLAGTADDSADVFINWAANVSQVTFEGGVGNDLLQNGGMNSSDFQFTGGGGDDLLLNLGYGAALFTFDAGDGDDVFENRGQSGGTLRMLGGSGDDAFYQNAGNAQDIELTGGDGDDTVLNFSSNMGRVALIGGTGTDILQNSGNDIGSLEVTGGAGKNTLQNFGNRIGAVKMIGSGIFAGAFDTLLNSGNTVALIEVTSNVPSTLISSGNDITGVSVVGSSFNDVVRITGNNIGSIIVRGNAGDDSVLIDTQSGAGSSIAFFGDAGDDLFLFRGFTSDVLFDGGNDNDQVVFGGGVTTAILRGNIGDDLYRFTQFTAGNVTIDEVYSRTLMIDDLSRDTLDFSSYLTGLITLDLAITTPQVQWSHFVSLVISLTDSSGIENVVGTNKADTILGNARNNRLAGAQFFPTGSIPGTPIARTKTQWVYLDFSSNDDAGEFAYTEAIALEVKSRVEQAYRGFDVRFVLNLADLPGEMHNDSSKYAIIQFNQTPSSGRPGGEASEIDFGNINPGGVATVQINGMLGGREVLESGLKAVAAASATADGDLIQAPDLPKPASNVENFIALSAKLGAHELGHLLGLRHYDAFGPVGFGIHSPPGLDHFKPTYSGVAAAFETMDHIISSPASIGSTRFNDLRSLYFGEREAIKLALAFSDQAQVRTNEPATSHGTRTAAVQLNLVTLDVPNLATGGLSKDKAFRVQAASVVGSIGLSGAVSESDWYSFAGNAGDIVTVEVMSRALKRYYTSNATSIDSVLRLYDSTGQLVRTFGADAVNDDEFESSDSLLMDVTLPANGQYYIEVDTFRRLGGDASYDAAVALRDSLLARTNDTNPNNNLTTEELQFLEGLTDSLADTDTGNYELLMYRSTSANATDGIDTIKGREGVDQINGGPGDDYSLGLQFTGAASAGLGSVWSGSFLISDRGGYSWTTTVNFGDGSSSIITTAAGTALTNAIPVSHAFAQSGNFVVTVTTTNDDGLAETRSMNVGVSGGVVGFDVATGMTQRSWIDSLDILFSSNQIAADLLANPARVKLTRFGLNGPSTDGSGGTQISFGGAGGLSRTGSLLKLNFGGNVIGTGRNSTAADGYYRLELDFDGDGVTDSAQYFYRLLGDVNGDRKVDATDANLIFVGMSRSYNEELNINGDLVVNNTDRGWTQRSAGRKLKDGLFLND